MILNCCCLSYTIGSTLKHMCGILAMCVHYERANIIINETIHWLISISKRLEGLCTRVLGITWHCKVL